MGEISDMSFMLQNIFNIFFLSHIVDLRTLPSF